jgi:hypothetical protein
MVNILLTVCDQSLVPTTIIKTKFICADCLEVSADCCLSWILCLTDSADLLLLCMFRVLAVVKVSLIGDIIFWVLLF